MSMEAEDIAEDFHPRQLEQAFRRFTEASTKLQEKYEAVRKEAKTLRTQLRKKDEEIQRAERLATLGKTAAAIAHEIRNPLGAIRLFSSLLKREVEDRPDAKELVEQIESSVSSLDHVVTNILQFSKDKPLRFVPLNIHAILQEQVAYIRETYRSPLSHPQQGQLADLQLEVELEGNPFLQGNEHALRQAVRNLLFNAVQAVECSGKIVLSCVNGEEDFVEISVADNGPGIPEEICDDLFDPFVTSRNEGTGLGLAITKQVVEQHGGTIEVENEGGAKFVVRLPRIVSE